MRGKSWQEVFRTANARARAAGVGLRCNPHKLRHSWATITLAQLQRRYNRLRRSNEARVPMIGDPLDWVSRRLGHRDVKTTEIYLHNLEELEAETILALIPDLVSTIPIPTNSLVELDYDGLTMARRGGEAF